MKTAEQDVDETKGEAAYTLPPPAYEPSIDVKQGNKVFNELSMIFLIGNCTSIMHDY